MDDADLEYAQRLEGQPAKGWRGLLDTQLPYRWNIRRLDLGRTLDVACGTGRHLVNLPAGSVGIDFNEYVVAKARERGCDACTPEEFAPTERFDSILLSHILEHLTLEESREILRTYLPHLKSGGRVVVICPQEKGFARAAEGQGKGEAHITFLDVEGIGALLEEAGLEVERAYSFPFPRPIGRVFLHNETVVVARGR